MSNNNSLAKTFIAMTVILAGATWFFSGYLDKQSNPNKYVIANESGSQKELVLQQDRFGHYVVFGRINGVETAMMLDTGATLVSVNQQFALDSNMSKQGATRINTANGVVDAWYSRIEHLEFSGLHFYDVPAIINAGEQESILLGMSVLKHLEMRQKDRQLIIRQ